VMLGVARKGEEEESRGRRDATLLHGHLKKLLLRSCDVSTGRDVYGSLPLTMYNLLGIRVHHKYILDKPALLMLQTSIV
jgi:hypothetical protein